MILGLKCDLSVTLSLKPITNFITNAAEYISNVLGLVAPKDGIVFNGKFNCNNWRVKKYENYFIHHFSLCILYLIDNDVQEISW